MSGRATGWALLLVGLVLLFIGVGWGRSGFYASDVVWLLLLIGGGGLLAVLGGRMLRKPKQDDTPVRWRSDDRQDG